MTVAVGAKYWQAVTLGATLNGPAMRCPYNGHLWGDLTWTGTPTGTFVLQARTAAGPWFDVPGAAAGFPSQPAGAAQATPQAFNFVNMPGDEFRLRYTGAGGGTVTANVGFGDVQE
jgi:hypothetical protein